MYGMSWRGQYGGREADYESEDGIGDGLDGMDDLEKQPAL